MSDTPVDVTDITTKIEQLSDGSKEQVAAIVDQLVTREARVPDSVEDVSARYSELDDEGKFAINNLLAREASRMERQAARS